ncbi:hypothetical protein ACFFNY_03610 [Paenibacillus hodogayensis]|uniref:Lipoprotein n=1 Tax=Paenibacillus hodogayensis TaxID=279208 RepID=A0ABV5VR60_9BACL
MLRKAVWCALLAVPALALLSGCGKSSGDSEKEAIGVPAPAVKDWTQEEFEVTFFANNGQKQEEIDFWFGDPLRKKIPKIKFTWLPTSPGNTMPEMLSAGQKFDVFFTTRGRTSSWPTATTFSMTSPIWSSSTTSI